MSTPHFIIKNKFQKRRDLYYEDILTENVLKDVCKRITGQFDYTVEFDNNGYNKGRLAKLEYQGSITYVSFSETEINGRNASFQSFASALVSYYNETNPLKRIYFYFLSSVGNIETAYFIFMYRLIKTTGAIFLNESGNLANMITPFISVSDLIAQRDLNRSRNRSNNSTYVTIDENNILQIYGKTFGANKYETTLFCLAIYNITINKIELYEIAEGNLTQLPAPGRQVIEALGITIITSDLTFERIEFETNNSLRSPSYIYNLLEKLGDKKCALCECEIPQLIQGAHIWPVASIKRNNNINQNQKLQSATDGDNGIWLCNNHHKLFDIDLLFVNDEGLVKYKSDIITRDEEYILRLTIKTQISENILTEGFLNYLKKRNNLLNEDFYSFL